MFRFLVPVFIFAVLAIFLAIGLNLNPREIPSPLIDKPAPVFSLPLLQDQEKRLSTDDLKGRVWLFNVWASWCVSCRSEHPVLNRLAQQKRVTIIGLNYKDELDSARNWLGELGNPYDASVTDMEGVIGIDWGVYGVPETFVVDKMGIIRYKHTGPINDKDVVEILLPLIETLKAEKSLVNPV